MNVRPARIDFSASPPRSLDFADIYHPNAGAEGQAHHVFLAGNGLPARWSGRRNFSILETGFGLGHNFLITWNAWQCSPDPPLQLHYVSLELHPPRPDDLMRAHIGSSREPLARRLAAAWPPLTPGLHLLEFEDGRLRLLLGFGDARSLIRQLIGRFDAFFLDGFSPAVNPAMWDSRLLKGLGRLAAADATAATWSVAREVRECLSAVGFKVERTPGFGGKRQMTQARYAPRFLPQPPQGRPAGTWRLDRRAMVVGAGLAGAAVAHALARRGWQCVVVDARDQPAQGASGNPAGLFHGVVHRSDGTYMRLHRAAALMAHRAYAPLVESGRVPGDVRGLLSWRDGPEIEGYARAVGPAETLRLSGVDAGRSGLLLPQAGWIDPSALVADWLTTAGVEFRGRTQADRIEPAEAPGSDHALFDAQGRLVGQAPVIVLAAGTGLRAWTPQPGLMIPALRTTRGQLTWFDHAGRLEMPLSGDGYALQRSDGRLVCGATMDAEEPPLALLESAGAPLRDRDHELNLERLIRLTGGRLPGPASIGTGWRVSPHAPGAPGLSGRAQWRLHAPDHLPLIGPLPKPDTTAHTRLDQARFVARTPGLFIAGAFGTRGLSWAPLAGELIAGWIEGTPLPLEADLIDAVDPGRWTVRQARGKNPARQG